MHATRRTGPRGFTLVELLVVVAIIGLISAVAIPVVLPALNERRVSEAARLVQAVLAGTRDVAIRANAPRGIRLLPDPVFAGGSTGQPLASNRIIQIEYAPDYTEGLVNVPATGSPLKSPLYLTVIESGIVGGVPSNPTNWFNNIRQGDKIRFNDSGAYYTIAGPVSNGLGGGNLLLAGSNPERFIIAPGNFSVALSNQAGWSPEYLYLMNGQDDNGNGWIDEACDGIDNDGDGITDPGFNGIDDNSNGTIDEAAELMIGIGGPTSGTEYETEVFIGTQSSSPPTDAPYTIVRRPVVSPGAREVFLPAGVVIDLTTWNASVATPAQTQANVPVPTVLPERSRLPVDPYTGYVDVMIDQSGRVITPGAGSGGGYYAKSAIANSPFYHFWITEREGVRAPLWDPLAPTVPYVPTLNPNYANTTTPMTYLLPMPKGTPGYSPMPDGVAQAYSSNPVYLTGERRLVTLFVKTGQISSNSIESFNVGDTNTPYYDAQSGIKESQ